MTTTAPARYTRNGSDALEQHLADVCEQVRVGVLRVVPQDRLAGLLLAGGYGRGEGGVLVTEDGSDAPYNDLEFYVFIHGPRLLNERRYRQALHHLGEELTPLAGIEVEFKILALPELQREPVSMFSYDFTTRNHWLVGDDTLLANCKHHRSADRIPMHEATRLLFNRCSGLLYAQERLQRSEFNNDDADFVGRNIAKAQLAMGDVLLTAHGRYHWSCKERHEQLRQLGPLNHLVAPHLHEQIMQHHAQGVQFKLQPQRTTASREDLAAQHQKVSALARELWLRLESRRLGQSFTNPIDYAFNSLSKCPEQPGLRTLFVNLRTFGLTGRPFVYPRERLLRALPLLLWTPWSKERGILGSIHRELRTTAHDLASLVHAYTALWNRFN